MDIVTYALCKKASKSYTDNAIAGLGEGIIFNGAVENYSDLPNNPSAGDSYIVHNDESTTPAGKNIQYVYGYDESVGGNTWIQISSGTDLVEIKKVSGTVNNPVILSELGPGYYLIEGSYKDNAADYISTFNTPGIVWVDMEDESYMNVINFEGDNSNQLTSYTWDGEGWVQQSKDSYALKSYVDDFFNSFPPIGYASGDQNTPIYFDDLYNGIFYVDEYVYNYETSQVENLTQPQLIRKREYKENQKQYLVIENLTDGTIKKYLRNNAHDYTLIDTTYNLTNKDLTEIISAQSTNEEVPTAEAVYEYIEAHGSGIPALIGTQENPIVLADLDILDGNIYTIQGRFGINWDDETLIGEENWQTPHLIVKQSDTEYYDIAIMQKVSYDENTDQIYSDTIQTTDNPLGTETTLASIYGLEDWDNSTTYAKDSFVISTSDDNNELIIYQALKSSTNRSPEDNPTYWTQISWKDYLESMHPVQSIVYTDVNTPYKLCDQPNGAYILSGNGKIRLFTGNDSYTKRFSKPTFILKHSSIYYPAASDEVYWIFEGEIAYIIYRDSQNQNITIKDFVIRGDGTYFRNSIISAFGITLWGTQTNTYLPGKYVIFNDSDSIGRGINGSMNINLYKCIQDARNITTPPTDASEYWEAKTLEEYIRETYEIPPKIEGTIPWPANLSTLPAGRYWLKGYVVLYNQPLSSGGGQWNYAKYPIFRGGGSLDSLEWKQYSEFSISEHIEDTENPNSYYIDIFGEGGNFARIHYDASVDYENWSLVWTIDPRNGEHIVG